MSKKNEQTEQANNGVSDTEKKPAPIAASGDVLKPVELEIFCALLDPRDFAVCVTWQQATARAARVADYVPAVMEELRKRGWVR